ncbi:hypothetical protein V8E55_008429 [Tylopilus felleus]
MVEIYLNDNERSKTPFLSIPNSDIERLSNHPFRWLRYIMFSICGAHGDLFETLDATGDPVDYHTSLVDLPTAIYYKPSGLNDRLTSGNRTLGHGRFRAAVILRDGSCVVTNQNAQTCDAAHLIPKSKGDEYIAKVVRLRSHLYSPPPSISGINDVQNRILLNKILHARLGRGEVAFIKTPNYGLELSDIKRVDLGSPCTDHITLQQLVKPKGDDPNRLAQFLGAMVQHSPVDLGYAVGLGGHLDVQFHGSPPPLPSQPPPPSLPPPPSPPPPPSQPPPLVQQAQVIEHSDHGSRPSTSHQTIMTTSDLFLPSSLIMCMVLPPSRLGGADRVAKFTL